MIECDDKCVALVDEWCEVHEQLRWECICGPDSVDSLCPAHGSYDSSGRASSWIANDYPGYPPDSDIDPDTLELSDGSFVVVNCDTTPEYVTAQSDVALGAVLRPGTGDVMTLKAGLASGSFSVALHEANAGQEVHALTVHTVQTKYEDPNNTERSQSTA